MVETNACNFGSTRPCLARPRTAHCSGANEIMKEVIGRSLGHSRGGQRGKGKPFFPLRSSLSPKGDYVDALTCCFGRRSRQPCLTRWRCRYLRRAGITQLSRSPLYLHRRASANRLGSDFGRNAFKPGGAAMFKRPAVSTMGKVERQQTADAYSVADRSVMALAGLYEYWSSADGSGN